MTVSDVKQFYYDDSISRQMPGKKDYISVFVDGVRQHAQKRPLLCNLKEAFQQFKNRNPDIAIAIWFSKFADLKSRVHISSKNWDTCGLCVHNSSEHTADDDWSKN